MAAADPVVSLVTHIKLYAILAPSGTDAVRPGYARLCAIPANRYAASLPTVDSFSRQFKEASPYEAAIPVAQKRSV